MSNYCMPHKFHPGPDEACPYCLCDRAFQEVRTLTAQVTAANARERPAFMAGLEAAFEWNGIETLDYEQAWQQYRCQDETDWKVVSEEDAAKIDAAVLGRRTHE